ncbi:MAG: hypothetical protein ABW071_11460 [Casimicrobiaceae bacterium]
MPTTIYRRRRRPGTRLSVQSGPAVPVKVPKLPHEHDESPEAAASPDAAVVQAHADVVRGLVNTDLREEAGRAFDKAAPKARKR